MEESEIKNALVLLYDRRLKSLLSYEDRQFTEELVEYMFRLFGQISERPERSEFKATLTGYMASVLAYPKNAFRGLRDQALLLLTLNEYVKECYLNLYDAPPTNPTTVRCWAPGSRKACEPSMPDGFPGSSTTTRSASCAMSPNCVTGWHIRSAKDRPSRTTATRFWKPSTPCSVTCSTPSTT